MSFVNPFTTLAGRALTARSATCFSLFSQVRGPVSTSTHSFVSLATARQFSAAASAPPTPTPTPTPPSGDSSSSSSVASDAFVYGRGFSRHDVKLFGFRVPPEHFDHGYTEADILSRRGPLFVSHEEYLRLEKPWRPKWDLREYFPHNQTAKKNLYIEAFANYRDNVAYARGIDRNNFPHLIAFIVIWAGIFYSCRETLRFQDTVSGRKPRPLVGDFKGWDE